MKVSIQAANRIALPLYTREVYHTFRSKTTGKQPELSIKVILSITFFDGSVPHLHSGSNRASSRSTVSSSSMHTCAQRTSVASRAGTSYRAR